MISSHARISMISLTLSLSPKLYLNSLVYHRNIFGSSSKVFGNLRQSLEIFGNSRKLFGNVCLAFRTILENFRKSPESGLKSSQNRQKRRHQYLASLRSLLRYCSCHSNIKFISSRHRVISSIYFFPSGHGNEFCNLIGF